MPGPRGVAPAIVVGLDCITGLQSARILAARGIPVVGLAEDPRHFCARTRACDRVVASATSGETLVESLRSLSTGGTKPVLFPCTDASVLTVSRHRCELDDLYELVLPPHDIVEMLVDKVAFYRYASSHGLRLPRTHILGSRRDAEDAAKDISFPAVVKPPLKTARWQQNTTLKAIPVRDAEELLTVYSHARAWSDVLIAQQWVEGEESALYSCNCYYGRDGTPLVTFVARKLRQWPPRTGTSSLGEECRNDVVLEETLRLFGGVGYRGLGYLEMKQDARTGEHFIIEPNIGRPTGRSAIAETGGVDLLHTMYCDALGLPLPERRLQTYGDAKWIYLRSDLLAAAVAMRRRELTLGQWRRSMRGVRRDAVFSFADPQPFLLDCWATAGAAIARAPRPALSRTRQRSRPAVANIGRAPGDAVRTGVSAASRSAAFDLLVRLLETLDASPAVLPVLTYHRIAPADASHHLDPTLISASPEAFRQQVTLVAAKRRPISLADLLRSVREDEPPREPSVLITFDDAYRDFSEHAWPVLREIGVPASLFVPTAYPDSESGFWWDRLYSALRHTARRGTITSPFGDIWLDALDERLAAFQRIRRAVRELPHAAAMASVDALISQLDTDEPPPEILSWEELQRLAADGVSLAPHSHTHPFLDRVPEERGEDEVVRSLRELRQHVDTVQPAFAFPAGAATEELVRFLPDAGIELAFTTKRGVNDLAHCDPLRLRRINVGRRSTPSLIRLQIAAPALRGRG